MRGILGALVLTTRCSTLQGSYDTSNLTEEQKKDYEIYLKLDMKNLTKEQKRTLDEFYSKKKQEEMLKEICEISREEIEECISVLKKYPWIRQDLWEYNKDPKEIIDKLNSLSKKDLLFYSEAMSKEIWEDFPLLGGPYLLE